MPDSGNLTVGYFYTAGAVQAPGMHYQAWLNWPLINHCVCIFAGIAEINYINY